MRPAAAVPLFLLALHALARADGPPPANRSAAHGVPLRRLTPSEARRLDGRRCRFDVRVEGPAPGLDRRACDCEAPAGVESVTVSMRPGQDPARKMVVEATLRVVPVWVRDGGRGLGAWYFLDDAVRR